MNLRLDSSVAARYSNPAQVARVVTEKWVNEELYCPACECDSLFPTPAGTPAVDFFCERCEERFQLKSQSRPFRARVTDAAYGPMMERIRSSTAPNFLFLLYHPALWMVQDLFFVPRFFLSPSILERRRALRPTARRAGWVGCNILLSSLPLDARIHAVVDEVPRPPEVVRDSWRRFAFLADRDAESRGWTADVLACVRDVGRGTFSLRDIYAFEGRLAALHPRNQNLRPKIRQQLQVLRDHGVVEFLGQGRYEIRPEPQPG